MDWWEYVKEVAGAAGDDSTHKISKRMGGNPTASAIGRWKETTPKAENVMEFARRYGKPIMEALVAAGLASEDEAAANPRGMSNEAFAFELVRRLEELGMLQAFVAQLEAGDKEAEQG